VSPRPLALNWSKQAAILEYRISGAKLKEAKTPGLHVSNKELTARKTDTLSVWPDAHYAAFEPV
jgi:hypothetical protein